MAASTSDPRANTKVQTLQGGDVLVLASGAQLALESGATLYVGGADVTSAVATGGVAGVAAGYKLARGVHQQAAATDTVATGLTTVVAVVVSWRDAPTVKQLFVNASIGDQSATPIAGSVLIRTYKPTAVDNVTPTAATDFTDNLSVNWIAVGV